MRILVIEPNKILGQLYKSALTKAGHEVELQFSAQSAIIAIDNARPDLILLELNLPRHNGVEFLYELRSYPEWQNVPVIIHSFLSNEDLPVGDGIKDSLGIAAHFYKPQTTLNKLVSAVGDFAPAV